MLLRLNLIFISLFSVWPTLTQAESVPSWFEAEPRMKLARSRGSDAGMSDSVQLEMKNFKSNSVTLDRHHLTLINASFEGSDKEASWKLNLSEVYGDLPAHKMYVQVLDEGSCESKYFNDISAKKWGRVKQTTLWQIILTQAKETCVESDDTTHQIILILQETEQGTEKLFESSWIDPKKTTIKFEGDQLSIEMPQAEGEKPQKVLVSWDAKKLKFTN